MDDLWQFGLPAVTLVRCCNRITELWFECTNILHVKGSIMVVCLFRRAEQSLFAQGQVKMISFFSCPWHPSAFQLFKSNFLGTYWSDSSEFGINPTTGTQYIIFQTFGTRKFFLGELLAIKLSILRFLRGQRVYFCVLSLH